MHNKISDIIREEMDAIGGQEVLMPVLAPKENWQATGRWDSMEVLFKLIGADKKEYALGATHEEIVTPLAKKFIFSYKELPVFIYQIQTKFRDELRAKAGLIRGREFSMKDLYSFHASEKDLNEFYKLAQKTYFKICDRCELLDITYLTYASGGAFSKYSHEFQTLAEAGEDTIYICDKCNIAINEEIIEEQKVCPHCGGKKLRTAKAVEIGNIFKLGTRFSKPFGLTYADKKGQNHDVVMGCYGIGPSRIMGAIVEVHKDAKGIIWPEEVAPFKAHLIEVRSKKLSPPQRDPARAGEVRRKADELYNKLQDAEIEVLYDDREEISAGEKFVEADLIGCPYRLVVSEKTLKKGSIEFKRRDSEKCELMKMDQVVKRLNG